MLPAACVGPSAGSVPLEGRSRRTGRRLWRREAQERSREEVALDPELWPPVLRWRPGSNALASLCQAPLALASLDKGELPGASWSVPTGAEPPSPCHISDCGSTHPRPSSVFSDFLETQ